MIPDIKIHEIVKVCLSGIRSDYSEQSNLEDTILYQLLSESKMPKTDKFRWFNESVEIFINRTKDHPKFLDTRLFFDRERASIPTIHIMVAGESKGKDGIGFDEGYRPEQVVGDKQRPVFNRQFDLNANIVITSDNTFETVIIYHVIKCMLISLNTHIQLLGFINPVIGGRDINISQDLVPNGVFARTINFSAGYELDVPEVVLNKIVSSVWFQLSNINNQPLEPGINSYAPVNPEDSVVDINNPSPNPSIFDDSFDDTFE